MNLNLYPLGTDLSHWDGEVDFGRMVSRGVAFTYIKASQGSASVDRCFEQNWSGAKAAGLRRGAYHYFIPNVDPLAQAAHFARTIEADVGELPPALDLEDRYAIPSGYRERVRSFLEALEEMAQVRPAIYTSRAYWLQFFGPSCAWAGEYPLWIANYHTDPQAGLAGPSVPLPWQPLRWLAWQFTSKGNGPYYGSRAGHIDLNIGSPGILEVAVSAAASGRDGAGCALGS